MRYGSTTEIIGANLKICSTPGPIISKCAHMHVIACFKLWLVQTGQFFFLVQTGHAILGLERPRKLPMCSA